VGDAKIHQGIGDLKVHDIKLDAGDSKLHGGGADLKVDTGDLKVHDVKLDAGATERQQHIGNVKFDDLKFQDAKVHDAPSGMGEAKGQDGGGGGTPSGMGEAKAHDGGGNDPARGSGMGEAKAHDGGGNDPARGLGMGEAKIHEPGKIDLSGSDLKVGFSDVKVQLGDIKGESIDPVHKPDFGLSADHKLEQPGDRDYGKVSIGYGDHKLYEGLGQKLDPGDIKLHEGADLKTVPIDHKIDMGDSKLGHDIKFGDGKLGPDDFKLGDSKLHEGLGQKLDPGDVKIHDGIGDQKLHDVGGLGTGGDASGGATDPGAGHGGGVYYGPDGQPHDAGSIQQTSTGQPYYVDSQGHGHAFYPAEGPGAEPAPGAHVDAHGMYMGSDGHPHHVGGDSSQVPAHSQPLDMNSKTGGPAGGPIEGDWKTGGGAYWGTDGQAHAYGTIETTSTGQAYYVDPQGNGHPFHPAAGPGAEPGPHAQVDLHGMYRGADGQMHHVGGDTSQVPAHSQALEVGGKAGGPTGGPIEGDWKMGGGAYWGTDGHAHAFGSIEHTSTGQAYYVDPQGNGHPFHPGVGPGAEPSPNAQVDVHGMYRGVDGQLHHVGGDTSQVPSHSQPLGVDGKTGGPAAGNIEGDWKTGGGAYWGPDGQAHAYGMIENTSTGQAYYVDAQGNGHAFFPADGPGAEPGPHAQVDVHGMYRGVDGQVHHVGGDPAAIPAHSDTFDAYGGKVGGPIGPIEGDWKAAGGGYWGTDGHAHAFGIIEHTSTGHAYYVDMQGNSHPFYPASGEGAVPLPNSQVDHWGMYRGVDGHMHHVGGNPGAIPAQAELVQQGAKGEVPQGTDAALKAGGGYAYWGSDGLAHPAGAIDHTSTGQAFYVDVRGHGHPFYPAAGEGAHPAPNAHVDVNGFYRGVDGQMHHVGQDPSEVPTTEEMVGSAGKGGAKF
jgi:ribosomal protein L31